MELHEIITINEDDDKSILTELLVPYKRSLLAYYRAYFGCEPLLMVTDVFNTCSYAKIVPETGLHDAICAYLGVDDIDIEDTESDNFAAYGTICANSISLDML